MFPAGSSVAVCQMPVPHAWRTVVTFHGYYYMLLSLCSYTRQELTLNWESTERQVCGVWDANENTPFKQKVGKGFEKWIPLSHNVWSDDVEAEELQGSRTSCPFFSYLHWCDAAVSRSQQIVFWWLLSIVFAAQQRKERIAVEKNALVVLWAVAGWTKGRGRFFTSDSNTSAVGKSTHPKSAFHSHSRGTHGGQTTVLDVK